MLDIKQLLSSDGVKEWAFYVEKLCGDQVVTARKMGVFQFSCASLHFNAYI